MATVPDMQELGSEQKKALNRKKGPVLLLSGAGSGKTTVLAHRYAQLYKGSKRPTILLLCPGASAARRMRGAVEQLTGPLSREWVVSFREAACRLLREQIEPGVRFTVWDDCDRETLVRGILKEFKMHEALFKGISAKIASLKARRITPERLVADQDGYGFDEKLARVYARYQDELRKNAALDLDDLVNRVVELLENDDDLKDAVTGSFDHILVDDLQDLTPAQYAFLKVVAGSGKGLYAAGDDDQDIVRSRMGKPEIISTFKADFPNAAVVQFSTNYRCTDPLLCAARTVIEKGAGGAGKTLKAFRSGDQLPVYSCTGNETEEAHHIAYLLKDLYLKDKYAYGDMAVLYRVPQQGKVISDVLRSEGIPIRTAVGPGFFSHPVVKDAVAYLRLLLNPGDDLSFERILNRPHRGVGDGTIARLRREAKKRDISLFETVAELSKTSKSLKKAGQLVKVFKKLARKLTPADDVVPLLRSVLETSGYADWILEQDGEGATAARRLGDLMALAEGMGIVDFVDRAALWSESYELNHGDGVRLMTVHQARGMEFPVVFLAGLEEGMLPYMPSRRGECGEAEERRIAYVAMTRAMDRLYLSGARRRKTFTGMQIQKASRFLDCLDESLCERFERSTRTEVAKEMPNAGRRQPDSESLFPVGARVRHTTWGEGVVRDCNGKGETARVTVNFPSVGVKRLAVKFANLERVT